VGPVCPARLEPAQRVLLHAPVAAHIEPKGHDQVKDNGGTEREERDVDKVQPDAANGYAHALAQESTHPKKLFFQKKLELSHFLQKVSKFISSISPRSWFDKDEDGPVEAKYNGQVSPKKRAVPKSREKITPPGPRLFGSAGFNYICAPKKRTHIP
jgi:hypothetical protein